MATREEREVTGEARVARTADDALEYESITERTARIEHKVVIAQLLLERLSPLDTRTRLLGSAVLEAQGRHAQALKSRRGRARVTGLAYGSWC